MQETKVSDEKQQLPKPRVRRPSVYLEDIRVELKKVEWPTKPHVLELTKIVFIVLVFFLLFVGVSDYGMSEVFRILKMSRG